MTTNIFHKSFCLAMKAVSNINHNQLIAVNNFILDNFQKVKTSKCIKQVFMKIFQ